MPLPMSKDANATVSVFLSDAGLNGRYQMTMQDVLDYNIYIYVYMYLHSIIMWMHIYIYHMYIYICIFDVHMYTYIYT